MPDEHDSVLDLEEIDKDIENKNKVEKRIKDLSEKVKLTSEERDELKRLSEEKDGKIAELERERDFLGSFSDVLAKHPNATQFKDEIKEKVLKGYSVEDAAVATLASKGELSQKEEPKKEPKVESPAGGAASVTQPTTGGAKPISEMTSEEKHAALVEAEEKGELYIS